MEGAQGVKPLAWAVGMYKVHLKIISLLTAISWWPVLLIKLIRLPTFTAVKVVKLLHQMLKSIFCHCCLTQDAAIMIFNKSGTNLFQVHCGVLLQHVPQGQQLGLCGALLLRWRPGDRLCNFFFQTESRTQISLSKANTLSNGAVHIRHQCRKTTVLSCNRFLISTGV